MPVLERIHIDPATFLYDYCALPALPEVVLKLQQALQSEDMNLDLIIKLISSEPALAAQVLRVVNSAYYSLPRSIGDIRVAVAYLGIREVNHIVLSLSVANALGSSDRELFQEIWFHSIYTAFWAEYLAGIFEPHIDLGELWASAVLHDVGKLVYLKFFPDHYKALQDDSETHGRLFSESERALSQPRSAYIGTLLCDRWRLPRHIREACAIHTLEDLKGGLVVSATARTVALANLVAVLTHNVLHKTKQEEITYVLKTELGLAQPDLLLLLGAANEFSLKAQKLME